MDSIFLMLPVHIKIPADEKNKLVSGVTTGIEKLIQTTFY